jgi:hypothetical protein
MRNFPDISVTKPTRNRSQDSRSSGRDLNPEPPDYETVLSTRS